MQAKPLNAETIAEYVAEHFPEVFVVQAQVLRGNKKLVSVQADTDAGIPIDTCARLNRGLRRWLEEQGLITDDFEVQVSSPGLGEPLRLPRQYQKYVGRSLSVLTQNGQTVEGTLAQADENGFVLEAPANPKDKKSTETLRTPLAYADVKQARIKIEF